MEDKAISDSEVTPGPTSVSCGSGFAENISLKLEVENGSHGMTNPNNMWQVYAVSGFLVLRWLWAKWTEGKNKKEPGDDSPADRPR